MFAQATTLLRIADVAALWSKEAKRPVGAIEDLLLEAVRTRLISSQSGSDPFGLVESAVSVSTYVSREDLKHICEDSGLPLPKFWFSKAVFQVKSKITDEKKCAEWIKHQATQTGRKTSSKNDMYVAAAKETPGLSRHAFDRAWSNCAPSHWKRPGRPRKPST